LEERNGAIPALGSSWNWEFSGTKNTTTKKISDGELGPNIEDHSSFPGLVMTNIAMVKSWPIEIDGLPIKNGGSFHGYVK